MVLRGVGAGLGAVIVNVYHPHAGGCVSVSDQADFVVCSVDNFYFVLGENDVVPMVTYLSE